MYIYIYICIYIYILTIQHIYKIKSFDCVILILSSLYIEYKILWLDILFAYHFLEKIVYERYYCFGTPFFSFQKVVFSKASLSITNCHFEMHNSPIA